MAETTKKAAAKRTAAAPKNTETDLEKAVKALADAVSKAREAGLTVKASWSYEDKTGETVNGRS